MFGFIDLEGAVSLRKEEIHTFNLMFGTLLKVVVAKMPENNLNTKSSYTTAFSRSYISGLPIWLLDLFRKINSYYQFNMN